MVHIFVYKYFIEGQLDLMATGHPLHLEVRETPASSPFILKWLMACGWQFCKRKS